MKIFEHSPRIDGRAPNELRPLSFELNPSLNAEGSCLIKMGKTHVLCTASISQEVPRFLKNKGSGWVTAEYSMLPRATGERTERERKGAGGRTREIERLISRALRASVDLQLLGERQIIIDCDVLNADGGTRVASINGGFVALNMAIERLLKKGAIEKTPIKHQIAAVSIALSKSGQIHLDPNYLEDSTALADSNFVMTSEGELIEVQASAEGARPIPQNIFQELLEIAREGVQKIINHEKVV